MKKLIRLLGSLELTLILMVLVSIWFALGAVLAVSSQYGNSVRLLNDQLVWKSLFELPHHGGKIWSSSFNWIQIYRDMLAWLPSPDSTVRHWLWGALVLAFLLGVNLILGTWEWVVDFFRRRLDFRKFLLLTMHVLFGVVLVGHLLSAVSGVKAVGEVPVRVTERIEFLNRYALEVEKIESNRTGDNPEGGGSAKVWLTPDHYVRQPLLVSYTLYDDGRPVHSGQVGTFQSDEFEGLRISLLPFSFRSQVSSDFVGRGVGPQIAVSRNPGIPIMLIFQPLWILVLLIYVLTTLRSQTES